VFAVRTQHGGIGHGADQKGAASVSELTPIDPQAYRWFWVDGELRDADGYCLKITIAAHADDLFGRVDAADAMAERVRKHYAEAYQMSDAVWTHIKVAETRPSQAFTGDVLRAAVERSDP
jgi:hypothetical protein